MDKHQRELVSRLFTLATEILEDTHEPMTRGQSVRLPAAEYRSRAALLQQAAQDLKSIAGAIAATLR